MPPMVGFRLGRYAVTALMGEVGMGQGKQREHQG